ncbi:aldolase [Exidia glandulosa HHB12029]|uniref:Aldolase n=1 Tax=Exidia glandulosa HHB12029 TaxID=1314781 RepID=A0A165PSC0_EXIGL|nr:aldolase [Exidia glandulosa HHB12029]
MVANEVHTRRVLKPGIAAPMPTFFTGDNEDLDIEAFTKHVVRIAKAGVGIVIAGSMGEAHHLTSAERSTLIRSAREALDAAGLHDVPIVAGTGLAGTRVTIELTREAAAAGADYAIVISAGYFVGALANNKEAQKQLFTDVADASPIPVIIYNYPGATGGLDLESDVISELAMHPNICGVKLTCGNVGKLTRIAAAVAAPGFAEEYPRTNTLVPGETPFLVYGGFIDFLVPSLAAQAHGAITGLANIAPYSIAKMYELAVKAFTDPSKGSQYLAEAQELQGVIADADRTIALAGIPGTKYLLEKLHHYGGAPRKPVLRLSQKQEEALWAHPHTEAIVKLEESLAPKKALTNGHTV